MSSLLELIARRRRASASRRLGPPVTSANGNGRTSGAPLPTGSWMPPPLDQEEPAVTEDAEPAVAEDAEPPVAEDAEPAVAEDAEPAVAEDAEPAVAEEEAEAANDDEQLTVEIAQVEPEPELEVEPEPELEPELKVEPEPEHPTQSLPSLPAQPVARYETWLPPAELIALPLLQPVALAPQTAAELIPPPPPAATELTPGSEVVPGRPGFLVRGRLRRRARYLRRLREIQLRDIGGFALELYRLGRSRPELVQAKIESALRTDRELRVLERALTGSLAPRELREAGVGGACPACGAVHGSADRFCAACGRPLDGSSET